ncbi:DUF2953 domain-containing protein [Bacillus sp. A301a_S52]|jgi:hypothetical protein|nr:DUF2953 domain-containing protein [Bacillus sp. A301a_S52]
MFTIAKIIIFIIVVLFVLIMFLTLTVNVSFHQKNKQVDGKVTLSLLFRLIRYTITIPSVAIDDESPSLVFKEEKSGMGMKEDKQETLSYLEVIKDIELFQHFLEETIGFYNIVTYFLSKVRITSFSWESEIGAGDAAKTGQLSGMVWSLKGAFLGILSTKVNVTKHPHLQVEPIFQGFVFGTSFQCMLSFRIGYAIHAAIKVWRHKKRGKDQREKLLNQRKGSDVYV